MMALLAAALPPDPAHYAFEIKWDGIRALAFHDGKTFRLLSRNALDATFRYPELQPLAQALGHRSAILDGEIIALDPKGEPSFPLLQQRMNVTRPSAVEAAARTIEIRYVLFDILFLDGHDLRTLPWRERREHLDSLAPLLPPAVRLSPVSIGGGKEMLAAATERGLEGVVAKRLDGSYEPGKRTGSWLKIKLVQRQELVVAGWIPEVGGDGTVHPHDIGALILAYHDRAGKLHHAGNVGTGFNAQSSADMVRRLKPLKTSTNPLGSPLPPSRWRGPRAAIQWVKPQLVVEVEYRRWPVGGLMHQSAFKGIRTDKSASQVIRELPAVPPSSPPTKD
jgi:bifunctional non-homologous end joining protein LigD